ncbi:tripartite motif-containing protein 16-like protein [Carassius gibelio]|uniref:tripartite motif-containing protein 16-like protein n=1 Tax=Carassius gibelio TaxID=101364 RepID=UPI002277438F|nr:tripartite motif-containing protein 16-like protein [Carassius gibelio]
MAEAGVSEDEFMCLMCLDLIKDPVGIPCGHSYCKSCITGCWDQEDEDRVYSCPRYRQTFSPRPALAKNTMLAEVVEKLKKTKLPADCYTEAGDMQSYICTLQADNSCLVCQESYCETHFDRHKQFHSHKSLKEIDATGQLKDMDFCKHHNRLGMTCITDQQCICLLCMEDEHNNHKTVSSAAQGTEKQKQLKERQMKFQRRIQQRQKDLQQLRDTVAFHKRSAQTAVEDSERIYTELICSIERSRSEVRQKIRDQEKAVVSQAEELIKRLEQEIDELRRRDAELDQVSRNSNHFLQSFPSLLTAPESTDMNDNPFSSLVPLDAVKESIHQLRDKLEDFLKEEIKKICVRVPLTNINSKTRNDFLQYSHPFTLDLNTVNENLGLSERNRVIMNTGTDHLYPDHPDRFDYWDQVLCRESVCGRCYWEIEWSGDDGVFISVSYKSISRKGDSVELLFGHNDQSWSLFCSPSKYLFWHNNKRTNLTLESTSSRIGVYVDHSAGTLFFYDVSDTMSLIHAVQTTFTQPLCPGFYVEHGSSVKLC